MAIGLSNSDGGKVYVYEYVSNSWSQLGETLPATNSSGDQFGHSVSLSSDGTTVACGTNGGNYTKIYSYISGVWTQLGSDIDGENSGDKSGRSVSLSSNGNIVAIGADFNDENGTDSGHTRIFKYINNFLFVSFI